MCNYKRAWIHGVTEHSGLVQWIAIARVSGVEVQVRTVKDANPVSTAGRNAQEVANAVVFT